MELLQPFRDGIVGRVEAATELRVELRDDRAAELQHQRVREQHIDGGHDAQHVRDDGKRSQRVHIPVLRGEERAGDRGCGKNRARPGAEVREPLLLL